MKLTAHVLKTLMHRAVLALVLLAFLVPGSARLPADDMRAAYVAAGLMCAPGETGQEHRDAHCVLCLLPALGAAPDAEVCAVPARRAALFAAEHGSDLFQSAARIPRHARAPPSSLV